MDKCVYMDLNGNCMIADCVHEERICEARKEKCEYESKDGKCPLNECIYGDFLFIDDSHFDTGRYCFCNGVTDEMKRLKEQIK